MRALHPILLRVVVVIWLSPLFVGLGTPVLADPTDLTRPSSSPAVITDNDEGGDTPDPWSGGSPVTIGLDDVQTRTFQSSADIDYFKLVIP